MKQYNILFLCTHNSARSILGEALASTHPGGKLIGYSAGSTPGTSVNPIAADIAEELGMDRTLFRSKSWDEFAVEGAPHLDFVFTVCDNAAGEVCPYWPGQPMTAHWGVEDPAAVEGTDEEKLRAFKTVARHLENRIKLFTSLRLEAFDRLSLKDEIDKIGKTKD